MTKPPSNDHQVLANIFFPGHLAEQLPILLPDSPALPLADAPGCFAFGKKPRLAGFQSRSFDFLNNPDGSIRWLYPTELAKPLFLKLYNGTGWRGLVFRNALWAAFLFGLKNRAKAGSLHVFYREKSWLDEITARTAAKGFAIFTGTVGDNRKAVVALEGKDGKGWFFKLPLTTSAASLVQNEQQVLAALSKLERQKIDVPTGQSFGTGLMLSDIKPRPASSSFNLQAPHFEALAELASQTLEQSELGSLAFWQETCGHLEALQQQRILSDLPPDSVGQVIERLLALRDELAKSSVVPTSLAHGDFTPWNMYLGNDKLHVYDWELSTRLPLLFDAFHFVFQAGILVKRQPYAEIEAAIFSLKKKEAIKRMLAGQAMGFEALYQFYLLRNISYYLLKYTQQVPLHEQAHWQLREWEVALGTHPSLAKIN